MKQILLLLMLLPIVGIGQVDTVKVMAKVDSLITTYQQMAEQRKFKDGNTIILQAYDQIHNNLDTNSALYAKCVFLLGSNYKYLSKQKEAEHYLIKAIPIVSIYLGEDHPFYSQIFHDLSIIYRRTEKYELAKENILKAIDLRRRSYGASSHEFAMSILTLAINHAAIDEFKSAEESFLLAKDIFLKVHGKNNESYARCIDNLALLYKDFNKFDKAEPLLLEALEVRKIVLGEKNISYAASLNNLGNYYSEVGAYSIAEKYYLESLKVRKEAVGEDNFKYGIALNNLGQLYQNIGLNEKSAYYFEKAEVNFKQTLGIKHNYYSVLLGNIGNLYLKLERFPEARKMYEKALGIQKNVLGEEHLHYANSLNNMGILMTDLLKPDSAIFYLEQSAEIKLNKLGNESPYYAEAIYNLAVAYKEKGDYHQAKSLLENVIEIWGNSFGGIHEYTAVGLFTLSSIEFILGNNQNAKELVERSTEIEKQLYKKAAGYLSERELIDFTKLYSRHIDKYFSMLSFNGINSEELSESAYNNGIFFKGYILNSVNRLNNLMSRNEESKAQYSLLKKLRTKQYEKEKEKEKEKNKEYNELVSEAIDLEKKLTRSVSGFGDALRQVNWQEIQAELEPGEATIEFVHFNYYHPDPTDSVFYSALILRHGDPHPNFITLFEESKIKPLLTSASGKRLRKINTFYKYSGIGNELYRLVWKPLEEYLSGVKTVYISPSGLLHRINLGAIPVDATVNISDNYQLITVGSSRQLAIPQKTTIHQNDAVLFGGILYITDTSAMATIHNKTKVLSTTLADAFSFQIDSSEVTSRGSIVNYLESTIKETKEISRILGASNYAVELDTGYYASEERFKEIGQNTPSPRILHIATHGYFYPDPKEDPNQNSSFLETAPAFKTSTHPMIRSGLLLAGSKQAFTTGKGPKGREDGVLTAYEISQMNLSNTELVVLSACETGLGDIEGNEGVYGLQRAFKIAGAKYLIMSLWKVNDQSTMEFMTTFYQQWLEQKQSIPEAFRTTQQLMRKAYPGNPYHWAGFVLVE